MDGQCQMVVFSNKAYNAIIRESFDKDLDNGIWVVMEVLPPGINSIFETAYFEYDDAFVNYLAQSVANQYKMPLELLGLWHRHPGSMDFFSRTDDHTNSVFAAQNSFGVISGLVNLDPKFRLTMYYLGNSSRSGDRPKYETVPIEVGDDIIPEDFFELRYYDGNEANLHPAVDRATRTARSTDVNSHTGNPAGPATEEASKQETAVQNRAEPKDEPRPSAESKSEETETLLSFIRRNKVLLILLLAGVFALALNSHWNPFKVRPDNTADIKTVNISIGDEIPLKHYRPLKFKTNNITWVSSSDALVIRKNKAVGVKAGEATISAFYNKKSEDVLIVSISDQHYHINKRSTILRPGQCDTLTVEPGTKKVDWASSNPRIASVDKHGIVTAVAEGRCIVKCKIEGELIGTCSVKVISGEEKKQDETTDELSENDSTVLTAFLSSTSY